MKQQWTKSRSGAWLLISLIPTTIVFFFAAAQTPDELFEGEFFWSFVAIILFLYWPCALVAGIVLTVWGRVQESRNYRETRQYGELHGWHPIAKTAWRNRKRGGVELAVNRAYKKPTYILTIVVEGETTTVDEFETALWALQFGDWLWEDLLHTNAKPDVAVVSEKRAEWEQTRAIAVYRG